MAFHAIRDQWTHTSCFCPNARRGSSYPAESSAAQDGDMTTSRRKRPTSETSIRRPFAGRPASSRRLRHAHARKRKSRTRQLRQMLVLAVSFLVGPPVSNEIEIQLLVPLSARYGSDHASRIIALLDGLFDALMNIALLMLQ